MGTVPVNTECLKLAVTTSDVIVTWAAGKTSLGALSFGCNLPVKCGIRIDIYFFGTDEDTFLAHVAAHFERYLSKCSSDRFGMMLHFPMKLDKGRIEKEITQFLGPRFQYFEGEDPTEGFIFVLQYPTTSQ